MLKTAKRIHSLPKYVPGKPVQELERDFGIENAIKLASNENPLGPSPKAKDAIIQSSIQVASFTQMEILIFFKKRHCSQRRNFAKPNCSWQWISMRSLN